MIKNVQYFIFAVQYKMKTLKSSFMKKYLLACGIVIIAAISCTYNDKNEVIPPADVCDTTPASFAADVQPLIQTNCAKPGCHANGSGAGGVVLETYEHISAKAARINQRALIEKTMPPAGPLSAAQINTIKCWIENGALNN